MPFNNGKQRIFVAGYRSVANCSLVPQADVQRSDGNFNSAALLVAHQRRLEGSPIGCDHALRLLARRGNAVPESHTERDWSQTYSASPAAKEDWLEVYRSPRQHWDLYQLARN